MEGGLLWAPPMKGTVTFLVRDVNALPKTVRAFPFCLLSLSLCKLVSDLLRTVPASLVLSPQSICVWDHFPLIDLSQVSLIVLNSAHSDPSTGYADVSSLCDVCHTDCWKAWAIPFS